MLHLAYTLHYITHKCALFSVDVLDVTVIKIVKLNRVNLYHLVNTEIYNER